MPSATCEAASSVLSAGASNSTDVRDDYGLRGTLSDSGMPVPLETLLHRGAVFLWTTFSALASRERPAKSATPIAVIDRKNCERSGDQLSKTCANQIVGIGNAGCTAFDQAGPKSCPTPRTTCLADLSAEALAEAEARKTFQRAKADVRMAGEMTRAEFLEYMKGFEERINQQFDSIKGSTKLQFEETRGLIRLSLEAVDALRESTEQGFREVRAELDEQTSLLKDAIRHVRGRIERVESRGACPSDPRQG